MSKTFNDPLFASQWYLVNKGQRGGDSRLDINVLSAWDKYTGKGVIVAVNDDGMDLTHPALLSNMLVNLAYDATRDTTGQGFAAVAERNEHGTVVGSIVGMAGNDGIGGVGVAYEAKIVPGLTGSDNAKNFLANLASGASVSVNSWGNDPAFSENFGSNGTAGDQAWGAALLRDVTEARNGLGMVIEVSGGNERATRADVAMTHFTSSRFVIAVGAVTETGAPTDYSSEGASLLLTAPGGVGGPDSALDTGFGIPSADIQGNGGYNKTAGAAGDYTYQNQGTSYSGPMVGGAAALMLQAAPNLGFRDVSTILAMTARKVDPTNTSWVQNKATDWNGGGMHFSRDFGFGLLDVSAAVRLAESWYLPAGTIANWQSAEGTSATDKANIPDNLSTFLTVTSEVANNVRIERMEFDLDITSTSPAQLAATITSPSGTTITLFDAPNVGADVPVWPGTFTIGVTGFIGESSAGTWTLKLLDGVTGVVSTYNSLTVRAWGSAVTADSQIVLTNEFAANNPILTDTSGMDTLNAAATAMAVSLNLSPGQKSTVGTGSFTIAAGTVIENGIGGLGDDTLIGSEVSNILRGNGGNDALDGSAGTDTALYNGKITDYFIKYNRALGTATITDHRANADGTDSLKSIEKLQFSDKTFDLLNPARTESAAFGKSQSFLFDPAYYLLKHPDLVPTVTLATAFDSYKTTAAQGAAPNAWFDPVYYANRWADLKPLNLDAVTLFAHYNLYGVWEGRSAGPTFDKYDGTRYLKDNPDVAAYVDAYVADFLGSRSNGAIAHYVIYGAAEGRVAYDTAGVAIEQAILIGVPG
jgi:subtilisin-like proprotein convertase family protein